MDCRKGLLFCLAVLVPLSGCTLRGGSEIRQEGGPDAEPTIKKPETYVAWGDYRKASSLAQETPPEARQGYREDAAALYLKAIEINPKHVPAYLGLASVQQASGDLANALETYKKALEVTTKDSTIWYELAMCQARQKRFDDAVGSLRKACELRPNDKNCLETMGYTLARAGQWPEALATLTVVVGEARANYALARMLYHMNRAEEARKFVAAALSREPELSGARELLVALGGTPPTGAPKAAPATVQVSAVPNPVDQTSAEGTPAPPRLRLPPRPVIVLSSGDH